jgi:hypothetical protein
VRLEEVEERPVALGEVASGAAVQHEHRQATKAPEPSQPRNVAPFHLSEGGRTVR